MNEYTKTINSVIGVIVKKEVKQLNKTLSAEDTRKRNISLQIAINREIEFVQSILDNAKVAAKDKKRFINKLLKMYVTEAENGKKINAKIIKKIRNSIINQIENYEIEVLKKKQKKIKAENVKKENFEAMLDKMMNIKEATQELAEKKKKILKATTLSKDGKIQVTKKLKEKKKSIKKIEKKAKVESTALVIQDDKFANRLKRTINDFCRKVQNLFKKSKQEKSFVFVEKNGTQSLLSQKSTSTNAFIKRVSVDMKKVKKLAAMNMNAPQGVRK